jgi:phasin family protein
MTKQEFPFMNADFAKMFGEFKMPDMSKMMADMKMPDMTKMLGDFKLPNLDVDAFMAAQRKNIDAVTQANKLAAEGFQAVAKRQAEIFKETMEQAQTAMKDLVGGGAAPDLNASKQAELAKTAFEKALANMKELAELTAKANSEAFDIINKRVVESLEEIKSAPKAGKK